MVLEFRFVETDSSGHVRTRYIEAAGNPVRDANGDIFLVCGTLTDLTALKTNEMYQSQRAEDALEMRQQQELLIDHVSHELRNPISAICLAVDSVEEKLATLPAMYPGAAEEIEEIIQDSEIITMCTKVSFDKQEPFKIQAIEPLTYIMQHMRTILDDVLFMSKIGKFLPLRAVCWQIYGLSGWFSSCLLS